MADPRELTVFDKMAERRAQQWENWERTMWEANVIGGDPKQGLMRYAGTLPDLESKATIWDVPTSMRNVDAECQLEDLSGLRRGLTLRLMASNHEHREACDGRSWSAPLASAP